jgi:hypothetical protein
MTERVPPFSSSDPVKPAPGKEQVEAAWGKFLSAREQAERTKSIEDGIAAGHAWSDFLHLFCPPAGRPI